MEKEKQAELCKKITDIVVEGVDTVMEAMGIMETAKFSIALTQFKHRVDEEEAKDGTDKD